MLSREENLSIFRRHAQGCDVAVVEGVMGLYDGFDPVGEQGSTAQMAKWLRLPVLLAVNARSQARSLAALARGFLDFDPDLTWVGLVANAVGSPAHTDSLRQAMTLVPGLPFRGGLPRSPELALPERHLGLITAEEGGLDGPALDRLADWLEQGLDLDALLADLPAMVADYQEPSIQAVSGEKVRLAVARDKAFCFYYRENLRRLQEAGAELVFFSPLADKALPEGVAGVYLGGGYPELFAPALSANRELGDDLRRAQARGLPIYAECGGMMYLGRELTDLDNRRWPMAGLLPLASCMLPRLRGLGYRQVTFTRATPLGPAGSQARGHEFHYSEIIEMEHDRDMAADVYRAMGRQGPLDDCRGLLLGNTLASYVHLHFGSNPELASAFVRACREPKG
jgi:cobyrinic acid a,c-diamide synthase